MSWKKTAAVFMTALCISGGASAYNLQSIAKAHLPPAFTYQDIPEQQELKFHNFTYPYHMGQLSVMLQKSRKFAYGYIVTAKLPPAGADTLKPFFREYLTVKEWRSLSRMNRAFLDEDSPLRKGAEEVMKNWAKNVVGELGEGVKITLSDFEPYRKLTADEAYLYTMGAKITFDSDGLIQPFYGRAYFLRENDHIDVMMLLTPDEGKEPLVYAIDDLAKAAAKETNMQEEKEDLSVMLAKGAAGN